MKLGKLFDLAIKYGMQNDPRSKKEISEDIKRSKSSHRQLKGKAKKYFDNERLMHPYADTRILHGNRDTEVATVMVGIDLETPELLLADRLREKGVCIDLVMAHHPEGRALTGLGEVMHLQKNVLGRIGLKRDIAKALMDERIDEVSRSLLSTNHTRSEDAAFLLDIPYMCVHTPADNHVNTYLQTMFDRMRSRKVKDVISKLQEIPEYQIAMKNSAGPTLIAGKETAKAGKVFVDMTGGTEGSKKVFARLSQAGVSTIVGMHFSEAHFRSAKAEQINLIIAGHISSDVLGLNLLLDNIEKSGELRVIGCSGFKRIKRK